MRLIFPVLLLNSKLLLKLIFYLMLTLGDDTQELRLKFALLDGDVYIDLKYCLKFFLLLYVVKVIVFVDSFKDGKETLLLV